MAKQGCGAGLTLPTFNGNQASYKTFNIKWRASYVSNSRNEEGYPLLYVIVSVRKEELGRLLDIRLRALHSRRKDLTRSVKKLSIKSYCMLQLFSQ